MAEAAALDSSVLVLNRFYMAVQVVSARRAFTLLFKESAEVVDVAENRHDSYNFDSWKEVSQYRARFEDTRNGDWVRTVSFDVKVPRIIRLLIYERLPRRTVKLNRSNIFARDDNRCQFCGKRFSTSELSLDHITPRSRGGEATWENMVCACTACNKRKGGRTPREAGMKLIRRPVMPKRSPILHLKLRSGKYETWKQFLDNAYWNVQLK